MTRLAKILIATTALAILPLSQACAAGSSSQANSQGSVILNGQVDVHTSISAVHTTIDRVGGDAGVQSAAAGNVLDVTTMLDTRVKNDQFTSSVEISSDLGARITNVDGSVGITGQAVCNSANISTDPNVTAVTSNQDCQALDPSSKAFVDANNIGGDFSLANSATGNAFFEDTNAPNAPVTTHQVNSSNINASTIAHVSNVAGTVNVSGSAIGNNAQIVHFGTGN